MKEFRLEVKLKNNLLVQRRLDSGLTLAQVAKAADLPYQTYLGYETLRIFPLRTNLKDWKSTALKITKFWNVVPEDLWPAVVLAVEKRGGSFALGCAEAKLLVSTHSTESMEISSNHLEKRETQELLRQLMSTKLTPKEQTIIKLRFGFDGKPATQQEVGVLFSVQGERIRQIEAKALRKLRHANHTIDLLGYDDSEYLYAQFDKQQKECAPCHFCGCTEASIEGEGVYEGYEGDACCPQCKAI